MKQKHVFIVYSGPDQTGKVFHALTHAKQVHGRGDQAELYFAAEGTGWPELLASSAHPMNDLFDDLLTRGVIQGACQNCANAFGYTDGAERTVGLVQGPEASFGQIDIIGKADDGYRVWIF